MSLVVQIIQQFFLTLAMRKESNLQMKANMSKLLCNSLKLSTYAAVRHNVTLKEPSVIYSCATLHLLTSIITRPTYSNQMTL